MEEDVNDPTWGSSPFLLDVESLRALASDQVIKRGIAYFKENRVIEQDWDDQHIWATVAGSRSGQPYMVALSLDADDEIAVDCDCPFDWEPLCKHGVAALLAYAAKQPVSHLAVESAADKAIEARVKRGRQEVLVEPTNGNAGLGSWKARSMTSSGLSARTYRVQIRSFDESINYCTCPDFAVNRLGTCKHIEAALHNIDKNRQKGYVAPGTEITTPAFVYLAWDAPDSPRVGLKPSPSLGKHLKERLEAYFDPNGWLRGELPAAFHLLVADVDGEDAIEIGDDVREYVRRLAEDAAHGVRREQIRQAILRAGNQLPGVRATLYPYQVEGVAFLASNGRALLADDMGLGKTLQAIAATIWLMQHAGVHRSLVVCPASLKHQWAREITRFTGHDAQVVQGPAATRAVQYRSRAAFTVVNYELVLRDVSIINEELRPDLLILDEAQRIKNWRTKTAEAIKSAKTRYAFVLTGTPLENRLEDLYSLMQVVDPRVLGPLWRYMLDFHVTDERGRVIGYRNLSELRQRLGSVMLRRDRRLVRDQLPDRIELRLDVPMSERQQALHDDALGAAAKIANILKRRPLTPLEEKRLLAALQRARMACDAAGLVDKETQGSPKLDELRGLLGEFCIESDRKVVVFSQWERMTKMAEAVAESLELGVVRLHGGVPTAKRGELLARFSDDPAAQVFISTDAGGVGLNLQAASVLINLDMPWNPAVLDQRIARVHRLGQRESVQVILMSSQHSYEERVAALAASKRNLFVNVVTGDATEDVVGLSKRTIELLTESLDPNEEEATLAAEVAPTEKVAPTEEVATPEGIAVAEELESAEAAAAITPEAVPAANNDTDDAAVRLAVSNLQSTLGSRIEQILAMDGGLMVVVDRVDEVAEAAAESASSAVAVIVIDARTRAAFERLGAASPIGGARVLDTTEPSDASDVTTSRLLDIAHRRLRSAEVLIEQGHIEDGLDLAVQAMLAAVAHRVGRREVPNLAEAAVWLYTEVLPAGHASVEEVTAISRGIALSQSEAVPPWLACEVVTEGRRLTT